MNQDMTHYIRRAQVLRKMGFASYAEYLKSPLWASVREKVFAAKGRRCFLCTQRQATQIHHSRYQRLDMLGKRLKDLFPLCGECHREIEFDELGQKLPVPFMRQAFKAARKRKVTETFETARCKELSTL